MSEQARKGRRRLQRLEIKGDPYDFIAKYSMSVSKAEILKFLYEMRMARTSQIQAHLGLTYRATQRILADLYVSNFVFRKFPMVKSGSAEGIYFLDTMGAFYLAQANDMTRRELSWSQKDNTVAPERTDHALAITEIRLALERTERADGRIQLVKFWGERRSGRRKFNHNGNSYEISMDAEADLILIIGGKKYMETVFIEFDLGFEDVRQIREKISRYDAYYESKEFKNQYQTVPDVLIICTNEIAERRFQKVILDTSTNKSRYLIGAYQGLIENPLMVKLTRADGSLRSGIVDFE